MIENGIHENSLTFHEILRLDFFLKYRVCMLSGLFSNIFALFVYKIENRIKLDILQIFRNSVFQENQHLQNPSERKNPIRLIKSLSGINSIKLQMKMDFRGLKFRELMALVGSKSEKNSALIAELIMKNGR
jgi:hypothetical protein